MTQLFLECAQFFFGIMQSWYVNEFQRLVATPSRTCHVTDNKYRGLVRSPRYPLILRLAELAIACKHFAYRRKEP